MCIRDSTHTHTHTHTHTRVRLQKSCFKTWRFRWPTRSARSPGWPADGARRTGRADVRARRDGSDLSGRDARAQCARCLSAKSAARALPGGTKRKLVRAPSRARVCLRDAHRCGRTSVTGNLRRFAAANRLFGRGAFCVSMQHDARHQRPHHDDGGGGGGDASWRRRASRRFVAWSNSKSTHTCVCVCVCVCVCAGCDRVCSGWRRGAWRGLVARTDRSQSLFTRCVDRRRLVAPDVIGLGNTRRASAAGCVSARCR